MPVSFPFFYRTTKPRDKKPMQAKMVKDEEDNLKRLGWGTEGITAFRREMKLSLFIKLPSICR
jgi:hypothetical protein